MKLLYLVVRLLFVARGHEEVTFLLKDLQVKVEVGFNYCFFYQNVFLTLLVSELLHAGIIC